MTCRKLYKTVASQHFYSLVNSILILHIVQKEQKHVCRRKQGKSIAAPIDPTTYYCHGIGKQF